MYAACDLWPVKAMPTRALLTLFESVGHDTWDVVYDPRTRFDPRTGRPDPDGVNVYQWLLTHRR